MGGRHSGRRDVRLQRARQLSRGDHQSASDRTLYAGRHRQGRVPPHGAGPDDVERAVDGGADHANQRRPAGGIRVPRRQLRVAQHPRGGARRGKGRGGSGGKGNEMNAVDNARGHLMRTITVIITGLAVLLSGAGTAIAHHSFAAEFDSTKPVSLQGVVTKMEWINPHSWIHLDVKNDDGTVTKWMIEGGT